MPFAKKPKEVVVPKAEVVRPVSLAARFKAIAELSEQMDAKHHTTNSLVRMGTKVLKPIEHTPTGMPTFDNIVLGCGGWPDGRVIEIFGPESSGKTTTTLHSIAQEQKAGGIAAFVDAEHAISLPYAATLGVDVDNLVLSQPGSGEEALDIVINLVKSMAVSLIVVDSVSALVPEAELAGEITDANVGLQARMMSKAMRMLVGIAERNKVKVIFINQIREKIGTMFGNPETTSGGRALKFYSSVRIDVRRRDVIKDGTADTAPIVGHKIELKAVKNKVGTPMRSTVVDLYYPGTRFASGFDMIGDTVTYASKMGLFEMSGSWYHMDIGNGVVEKVANGLPNLKERLRGDDKAMAEVNKRIAEYRVMEAEATKKGEVI
jgi:recombination protein RecA